MREIRFPVAFRTRGYNGGVAGPFYDMKILRQWFDSVPESETPTMPHSREPAYIALHRMVPVRWREGGEAEYELEEAARLLKDTQDMLYRRFSFFKRQELSNREYYTYGQYLRFRGLMAKWSKNPQSKCQWLDDYWTFHPYIPDEDIRRGNLERPDPTSIWKLKTRPVTKSWNQFRLEMAQRLNHEQSPAVKEYWMAHPMDARDDDATKAEYSLNEM